MTENTEKPLCLPDGVPAERKGFRFPSAVLAAMVCLYIIFFMSGIFKWLYYDAQNAEMLSIYPEMMFRYPFYLEVPQTYVPYIVAFLCVYGFLAKQKWAWWLAVAATLFELVSTGRSVPNYLNLTALGFAGMFKLSFILLFAAMLFGARTANTEKPPRLPDEILAELKCFKLPWLTSYLFIVVLAYAWLIYLQFVVWRGAFAFSMLKYLALPLLIPGQIIAAHTLLEYRNKPCGEFRLFLCIILIFFCVFLFLIALYLVLFHSWRT